MNYRADIDGLRAISIISVIGFHFQVPGFDFGFAGVDLFFVISGYLITYLLLREQTEGRFSYAGFLTRRAKRLLPAYFTMIIVMLAMAALFLSPSKAGYAGQEAAAASLFISNFFFANDVGYFARAAEDRMFLHTWSLSVEEQFYIIWPWLCFGLATVIKRPLIRTWIIAVGVAGLLGLAHVLTQIWPEKAFFWPHTRAWELGAGAALASLHISGRRLPFPSSVSAGLGVIALIASVILIGPESRFPGIAALPVILAGVLLIDAGYNAPNSFTSQALGVFPARVIGKISYSLYLWHWPILVFFIAYNGRYPAPLEIAGLIALSLLLSALSWWVIEQPIRHSKLRDVKALPIAVASLGFAVVCGLNAKTVATSIQNTSIDADAIMAYSEGINPLKDACHLSARSKTFDPDLCMIGNTQKDAIDVLIIGDSHADHWTPGLDSLLQKRRLKGLQLSGSSCLPIFGINQIIAGEMHVPCEVYRDQAKSQIEALPPESTIILAARWSFYIETGQFLDTTSQPAYVIQDNEDTQSIATTQRIISEKLKLTINALKQSGHTVILISQVPEYGTSQTECVIKAYNENGPITCGPGKDAVLNRLKSSEDIMQDVSAETGVTLINPRNYVCSQTECSLIFDGTYLYRDDDHLSVKGSEALVEVIFRDVALN